MSMQMMRNFLLLHDVIFKNGKWNKKMLQSANKHLRNCFVFFTGLKPAHDCLLVSIEIIKKTYVMDEVME